MIETQKFQKLTPTDDVDLRGYEDAFNYVFDNDDIKNIGISGPYSSGKSSLIESYKNKHKEKKFIHISLARFKMNDRDNNDINQEGIELTLEGKILNQLIQQIEPKRIPQTNFNVKSEINKFNAFITSALIVCFITCFGALFHYQDLKQWIKILPVDYISFILSYTIKPYSRAIYIAICIIISYVGIYRAIVKLQTKGIFKKINFQGNEIEILSNSNDSYFDKYLNEVIYIFMNANADVIVFEDLDRFEVCNILERIREINQLVNYKLINHRKMLKFFYLVRDDIFINTDRTKFFDFIIPVIPVIYGYNAYEKLNEMISDPDDLAHQLNEILIKDITLYIDDFRILKNIYNEYRIYEELLNTIELDRNKLLGIITYKNLFPDDFSKLYTGEGYVYSLFKNKDVFVQKQCLMINNKIYDFREKINILTDEQKKMDRVDYDIDFKIHNYIEQIDVLEHETSIINRKQLHQILTRDNEEELFNTNIIDNNVDIKENISFGLLKYLIRNGIIDETYNDYLSYFYAGSLTRRDKIFLRSIKDRTGKNYTLEFDNAAEIMNSLDKYDFLEEEILNFKFSDYLIESGNYEYQKNFFKLVVYNQNFDFLFQYLEKTLCIGKVLDIMISLHPNIFYYCNKDLESRFEKLAFSILNNLEYIIVDKLNRDERFKKFVLNIPHLLIYSNDNYSEVFIDNIKRLGIKFENLDMEYSNPLLLKAIYERNLYTLNVSNIITFIQKYYNINEKVEVEKLFTTIRQVQSPLYQYVNNNIEHFLDEIFVYSNSNAGFLYKEDEDAITELLNYSMLDIKYKYKYIDLICTEIDIDQIEEKEILIRLFEVRKVKYSIINLWIYYKNIGFDILLIDFINHVESNILQNNNINEDITNEFFSTLLSCNEIKNEKYLDIIQHINSYNIQYDLAKLDLSIEKLQVLLKEKILQMDKKSLIFMRENHEALLVEFILFNMDSYIKLVQEDVIYPDELESLVYMDINDEDKIAMINKYKGHLQFVNKENLSFTVISAILINCLDFDELPDSLWIYSKLTPEAQKLTQHRAFLSIINTKRCLESLDYDLAVICIKNSDLSLEIREQILFNMLSNMSFEMHKSYFETLGYNDFVRIYIDKDCNINNNKILSILNKTKVMQGFEADIETNNSKIKKILTRKSNIDNVFRNSMG